MLIWFSMGLIFPMFFVCIGKLAARKAFKRLWCAVSVIKPYPGKLLYGVFFETMKYKLQNNRPNSYTP